MNHQAKSKPSISPDISSVLTPWTFGDIQRAHFQSLRRPTCDSRPHLFVSFLPVEKQQDLAENLSEELKEERLRSQELELQLTEEKRAAEGLGTGLEAAQGRIEQLEGTVQGNVRFLTLPGLPCPEMRQLRLVEYREWKTRRKYVFDVTSVGLRSSPWTRNSVKVEISFTARTSIHFPSAQFML